MFVVVEAAHDVQDGVGLANVREELVAEALTFRSAAHQSGDIDELDVVGTTDWGLTILRSGRVAGPGTATTPVLGSIVQNG